MASSLSFPSYGRPMQDPTPPSSAPESQDPSTPRALAQALETASPEELQALRGALARVQASPPHRPWTVAAAIATALVLALSALVITLLIAADVTRDDARLADRVAALETERATRAEAQRDMPAAAGDVADLRAAIARLESRTDELETLRQQMATLEETLRELGDGQPEPPDRSEPDSTGLRRDLDALQRQMMDLQLSPPETAPHADAPVSPQLSRQLDDLEKASIAAIGTLDERVQAIAGELAALREQDAALAAELENTRVALDAELVRWRERESPPIWRLSAKLAGVVIRFSEGNRLADPAKAENTLRSITGWVLEAGPEIGLRVVGYADIDGAGEPSNRITSQKRADAVRDMLVVLGIPADRVVAVGRSTEDRLVDDDGSGNANRRVSFEPFLIPNPTP